MNLTVEEAYKSYESYYKTRSKLRSIDVISSVFRLYILTYFKNRKMCDISKIEILNFEINFLDKQKISYSYKKIIYNHLATFFNYCKKYLDLEKNVVSETGFILKNKTENKKIEVWTYNEFKRFIKKVDHKVYKYFFDFLFFTGCREGEAIALTFKNINKGIISIERTKIKGNRGFNSPKTKESIRKFKIDLKLRIEIYLLKKLYKKQFGYFDIDFYIFGGAKSLAPTTIERYKNNACKKANVKQIRIHDFRHSHITMLLSKGVPITAICERVGHKDISTTLNVYSHVLKQDNKKLINSLNLLRFSIF